MSKAIDPPHGPKSVGVGARAPAWPRAATVSSQAGVPDALNPPGPPRPSSLPPSDAPPAKIRTWFCWIVRSLIWMWAPDGLDGLNASVVQWLTPPGAIAESVSPNRLVIVAAAVVSATWAAGWVPKKLLVSKE